MNNKQQNTSPLPADVLLEYEPDEAEETLGENALMPLPAKRLTLLSQLRCHMQDLPKITDPGQKKAGANILRFLALILVLTLIARGTAGATLALVSTDSPVRQEIIQHVNASGAVSPLNSNPVTVPSGLKLEKMLVSEGQKVTQGDALARFAQKELEEMIVRESAALKGFELKLQQLLRGEAHDGSALALAQNTADRARQDYAAAEKAVADALAASNNAQNSAALAEQEYARLSADASATPEDVAAAQNAAVSARAAANDALAAHNAASNAFEGDKTGLQRRIEDADATLQNAKTTDTTARQELSDRAAQNRIDTAAVNLDIASQKEKLSALNTIKENDGTLKAEADGVVLSVTEAKDKTGDDPILSLSSGSGGFVANALVPKKDAEKLSGGDECEVSTEGGSMYYKPTVTGKILSVSPPDENDMCNVKISLPNDSWKPNQSVDLSIVLSRKTYDVSVPLSALHSDSNGYYILIVEETSGVLGTQNKVVSIPVSLVAKDNSNAAIEGAVPYDAKIISSSSKPVINGDKVRLS